MRFFDRSKERPPEEDPLARLRRYTAPEPAATPPAPGSGILPTEEEMAEAALVADEPAAAVSEARIADPSESTQEILGSVHDVIGLSASPAPPATAELDLEPLPVEA